MSKTATPATPKKLRSLEMMSDGRGGKFNFRFDQLSIPDGYNPRKEFEGLDELGESIMRHGLQVSLIVERDKDSETIWVLDGERRYRAIEKLIRKGLDPGLIPCVPRPRGTSALDRDLIPLIANSGRELTLLEKGRHYLKLIEVHGVKAADIARSTQTTKQAVSDALRLVKDGSTTLLNGVDKGLLAPTTAIAIIKQAGEDHTAQDALLAAAANAAKEAGSEHITPKHIPEPDPLEGVKLVFHRRAGTEPLVFLGRRKDGTQILADRCIETNLPDGNSARLNIGWSWGEDGIWQVGYYFSKGTGERSRENYALCMDTKGGEKAARHGDLREALIGVITLAANFHGWDPKTHTAFQSVALGLLKDKDFRNPNMKEAPADTGNTEPESSPDSRSLTPDPSPAAKPTFKLYSIANVPEEPADPEGITYHETDRLALTSPPSGSGIILLHLLSASTPLGFAYGCRINSTTHLPNVDADSLGMMPDEGYRLALDLALESLPSTPSEETIEALTTALFNAFAAYYPEEGEAEEAEEIEFIPTVGTPDPNTGYQGILNAPSTNRDGSAPGKGEGGYSAPDKQMEKINGILEAIAEKGNGNPDRITTAELILGVLRNESSTLTLRQHLTGK